MEPADITTIVALLGLITAFIWLKPRRDFLYGSGALCVAVLVETGLGHLINGSVGGTNHDALTILHIPLALAIMVLAMWLSARVASSLSCRCDGRRCRSTFQPARPALGNLGL